MKEKKVIVLSLGGSLIFPDSIDFIFLRKFKKTLRKHYKNYKFVVVCGGGSIARKYIKALKAENKKEKEIAFAGIRATRLNALFLIQLFGKESNDALPLNMNEVKDNLRKNNVVFCGALRYEKDETSDGTAAKLASYFKTSLINITNVKGLYSEDPKINPSAKFIKHESWKEFEKRALAIKFKAGQHFVLDQNAAIIIKKHKILTYIIGKNLKSLDNILRNRKFEGTLISE